MNNSGGQLAKMSNYLNICCALISNVNAILGIYMGICKCKNICLGLVSTSIMPVPLLILCCYILTINLISRVENIIVNLRLKFN